MLRIWKHSKLRWICTHPYLSKTKYPNKSFMQLGKLLADCAETLRWHRGFHLILFKRKKNLKYEIGFKN